MPSSKASRRTTRACRRSRCRRTKDDSRRAQARCAPLEGMPRKASERVDGRMKKLLIGAAVMLALQLRVRPAARRARAIGRRRCARSTPRRWTSPTASTWQKWIARPATTSTASAPSRAPRTSPGSGRLIFISTLKEYKSGARSSEAMTNAIKFLSDDALIKVSAYFASLDPAPVPGGSAGPAKPDAGGSRQGVPPRPAPVATAMPASARFPAFRV